MAKPLRWTSTSPGLGTVEAKDAEAAKQFEVKDPKRLIAVRRA
ncbi:MAG TPA: hypothetical protein VNO18_03230 [Xanthobacteraceae bacterium]|nr:hypothetical protein [Xanthobacteraceae bacterium]